MRMRIIAFAVLGAAAAAGPASAGAGCGTSEPTAVWVNGSLVKPGETATPPRAAAGTTAAAAPTFVNGGQWPAAPPAEALADESWCGGAYRPDAGTNFGG